MNIVRHSKSGGFTLIELLVVIAIIGILSSVVLVSLNSARSKGKDTHVISDVQQIRTQIESDSGGNYNTSFASSTGSTLTFGGSNPVYNQIFADLNNNSASTVASSTSNNGAAVTAKSQLVVVASNGGSAITVSSGVISASTPITAYAIYGYVSSGSYFCIDSTGKTNQTAYTGATTVFGITCP